ncbi:RHS repeat domain-containing protein [Pseudomonas rustica]|uniref:RHS repeat domain-containing protein n=1 Tax=Pseudomonas rustica TaxID=2827099 RepID=UPI003CF1EC30
MFTSARSNRSLAQLDDGSLPGESQIALGFDAAGNQLELQRGQAMAWNVRNELSRVTLVQRGTEADDFECYIYDQPGHRLRKTQISRASGQTLTTEVRYLSGLEIHCEVGGVERHVVSVEAGRNQVRLLHWPEGAVNDQWRYSLGDHLGSCTLELDESAGILNQEYFYAFGSTACWAGKSALTAKYRSIRYSGKERDATGLYYYGYRYYVPWLQRWISPDPAGRVNGINIYTFVGSSPILNKDVDGRVYQGRDDKVEAAIKSGGAIILARGIPEFPPLQASRLLEQLYQSEIMFKGAQQAIIENLRGSKNVLLSHFGPEYRGVTARLLDSFARGEALAKQYREPVGIDKFIGAISIFNSFNAQVDSSDIYGRVMVNFGVIDDDDLDVTLAHELSHLIYVDGMNTVGAGAVDNFYLGTLYPDLLGSPAEPNGITHQSISDIIRRGGLTVNYMESYPASRSIFIDSVKYYLGGGADGISLSGAVSVFNSRPDLRADISVNNADSVAFSAKSLNLLYRARQANNRLLVM